ncbi:glutaminase [Flexithrix dorotheae]|uniref:glutaminase n=1 Tax=Flexithrix dorotheae TaxID=70993 RepID=UPI000371FC9B|nr:glutaminase [Flexithrix dorotheae]
MDYQNILNEIHAEVQPIIGSAPPADYIPELANVDNKKFGISLTTISGEEYGVGDTEVKFSIQSISKVITLAKVFYSLGDQIWERVGVEPSGTTFNSLTQLEFEKGIPRNPFLNSGALVITDMLISIFDKPKEEILRIMRSISGNNEIIPNLKVAESEIGHSERNKALAYMMKSFGNIHNDIDHLLEVYAYQCAIEMTCKELSKAFLLFANNGFCRFSNKRELTVSQTKRLNAIMQSCGFYDEAGEFAFKVGLPGKSGVGGGIVAVLPGQFSISVWNPGLNKKGNSLVGMKALELFTTKSGISIF